MESAFGLASFARFLSVDVGRSHSHAISTPSRAICGTDCPLESIRLMIAIDEGTIPGARQNQIGRIGLGQERPHADEKFDVPLRGKCDRWLCRSSCFDIAEARHAQAL